MCRIFGNPLAPITGAQGPKIPRDVPMPHYEVDDRGVTTPYNFDNDAVIQVFEEALKTFVENGSMKHPSVQTTADALAKLYDIKAAVEKNVLFYDKAIEFLKYANTSREQVMGRGAQTDADYIANLKLIAKIERKKQRRLAKSADKDVSLVAPSPRIVEVRLVASGKIIFMFEDGRSSTVNKPGAKPVEQFSRGNLVSEFDSIDDDVTERFAAPPFHLQDGEFIVGVIAHVKEALGQLSALCFHTSKGRRSQWFEFNTEEPRGREYQFWAAQSCHVIGLEAKHGNIIVPCRLIEGHRGSS